MPQTEIFKSVFSLEATLGASWPNIRASYQRTLDLHDSLTPEVDALTRAEDASVVVFGSLARFEVNSGSDIDWTYLVDGQANLRHQRTALGIDSRLRELKMPRPGREGVFGSLAFSHDLLQYIGGQDDTNANLTRRILLLLESKPLGRRDAYDRVIRVVLDRYLSGDYGWIRSRTPYGVPRFLCNDISRYWRTVAVDFAHKQWARDNQGWALRSTKLRMSRKLTYAAGLLYCFHLAEASQETTGPADPMRKLKAIERLWTLSNRTPLDILAEAFAKAPALADAARNAFAAYDSFLGMLQSEEDGRHLAQLKPEEADLDDVYRRVRGLGQQFQNGLTELFIAGENAPFFTLTKEYGVF